MITKKMVFIPFKTNPQKNNGKCLKNIVTIDGENLYVLLLLQ